MSATESMGCVPSIPNTSSQPQGERHNVEPWKPSKQMETVVQAYVRLDGVIAKAEMAASAAQLAALIPLIQTLQQELTKASEDLKNPLMSTVDNPESSMLEIVTNLRVSEDSRLASEHEEFIANINRQIIYSINQSLVEKEFTELSNQKTALENEVMEFQTLYREQDILLDRFLGAQYSSSEERQLEARLGGARALRDTMSVAASGWTAAARRVRKAQTCAEQGLASWQLIPHASSLSERVHYGMDCLRASLEGLSTLRGARSLLPSVHFPHCTVRQLQALTLTLEYMFSDMFSQERFNHATRVFTGFAERSLSLATWMTETLSTTLQKDLEEVDETIINVSSQLRVTRVNLMAERGFTEVVYQQPEPDELNVP